MLWNDGNVGKFNDDLHWKQFAKLLKAGIGGVRETAGKKNAVRTMIHIDCGGNNTTSRWFFDNITKHNVEFDLIGLSYYPWWHGTMKDLEKNMHDLAARYGKDIVVVETAHPWFIRNPGRKKKGEICPHPDYEASVDGQRTFLKGLIELVRSVPGKHGKGVVYWAPEWIPTKEAGSYWNEATLFDNLGQALPSINAFNN
jgi:arabinogalactan endo-1,4-beta-galactosidase